MVKLHLEPISYAYLWPVGGLSGLLDVIRESGLRMFVRLSVCQLARSVEQLVFLTA